MVDFSINDPLVDIIRVFISTWKEFFFLIFNWFFLKFGTQVYFGFSTDLCFVWSYLNEYAHNDIVIDFSSFGIHNAVFPE